MGQQLFKSHLEIFNSIKSDDSTLKSYLKRFEDDGDDINFFFTPKSLTETDDHHPILTSKKFFTKKNQDQLSSLTKSISLEEINIRIDELLMKNVFTSIENTSKEITQQMTDLLENQQRLQTSLTNKIQVEKLNNKSIFSNKTKQKEIQSQQLSYFAIQSLSSVLLILIKSVEKNDPTIIDQILSLTYELCEQIPMKSLSPINNSNFLFKSLNPIINYIKNLSLSNDSNISKQALRILLSFSIAKASFKDLLPLINRLIFNKTETYDVQNLFVQLNDGLTDVLDEQQSFSSISLDYLKSNGVYPNIDEKLFTGEFISSIILSHIDIDNDIYSNQQLKNGSIDSSFSFEFHSDTFKQLFEIIEQLSSNQTNSMIIHVLTICLKLFTTHLKFLCTIKTNLDNFDLNKWFEIMSKLVCDNNQQVCQEASKALVYIINQQATTFPQRLSLMHQYIIENQHSILIKELLIEMNRDETLVNWIEVLYDNQYTESDRTIVLKILYSFIDIYFSLTNENNNEQKEQIQNMLMLFQQLLLYRLVKQSNEDNKLDSSTLIRISSIVSDYISYILKKSMNENELLNSILLGICLMTKINEIFSFEIIQRIFANILPLLVEFLLQNLINQDNYQSFMSWLLGRMSHIMISGSPLDPLEIKHTNKLKSLIFAGGCETSLSLSHLLNSNLAIYSQFSISNLTQESPLDKEFLMSIYNNTGEGAQLISKMKLFVKNKQHLIQKSIEDQCNDLFAVVFSVYIKYYRRLNLAKHELTQSNQTKPHHELLTIYEYANNVQNIFATIKAQGGDCNQLYEQIKTNALYLLSTVKESDLIPIIEGDSIEISHKKKKPNFQRQISRWTKAKHVIRLLRNLMQACIRFKRLMVAKKQVSLQKYDHITNLRRTIDAFLYGHFSKVSNIEEIKQIDFEEITKCLNQQYERAMTRFITYRFAEIFIQNICNLKDHNQIIKILSFYLPQLRYPSLEWSYLENIPAVHSQLKEEIRKSYYYIIKLFLSYLSTSASFQSRVLLQNLFYLLNLSYESDDICHMYNHQYSITLFTSSVSFIHNPDRIISLDLKFITYYWFRLFVFQLCENIYMDTLKGLANPLLKRQREMIFNTLILNELKDLKELRRTLPNGVENKSDNSLKFLSIGLFNRIVEKDTDIISTKLEIDLCINQYLALLLRCVNSYEHIRPICATVDYIEELLFIYHHSELNTTNLLILKILRQLIPYLPESEDKKSNILMEKLLIEILFSIGEYFLSQKMTPEITTELIYIYRTIMNMNSAWQKMSIQLIVEYIKSHDQNQINYLLASLSIIGGYIQPLCLGSTVKVSSDEQMNDEYQLAIIIEINFSNTPYLIRYLQTNEKKWVTIDQLQLEIDIQPPNLLLLPNSNEFIDSILDGLGYFIQIDTSKEESEILLQLKRLSITALYHIINTEKLLEIFIQKPYASIISQLAISDSLSKDLRQPADIRIFTKQHLEQYCLSLDTYKRTQVDGNKNEIKTGNNQLIIDTLSISMLKYNGWKPYFTKEENQLFKKGRIGSNEISIVPMPNTAANLEAIEECGTKHRFNGRVVLSPKNIHVNLPTFVVDNLRVNEGKWYYCVRVPKAGLQMGWAADGFAPQGDSGLALGDDGSSWAYDGTRDVLLNRSVYADRFGDVRWKENDVCGCGIEIDGENTNIKYWLNGKYLGTAFKHQANIASSSTQCDLLPNEAHTAYYPGISLQFENHPTASCEFIFSPEDMQECPLPDGYKPLLLPKLIYTENSIVAYPHSAYLIGDNLQNYLYTARNTTSTTLVRDFVNEHHIEIDGTLKEHQLILSNTSSGFPLSIDNDATSYTISFDFQILSTIDEQMDLELLKFDSDESSSIRLPSKQIQQQTRIILILLLNEEKTQMYINNECQTFETQFPNETEIKLYLLPNISAGINNIGIWKYALSIDHIHRLSNYGIFYVAVDYQQIKEYRKRVNTFSFTTNEFSNEILLPFNEPFEEILWEKKKKEMDHNESKYFNESSIDLYGNQTYLVLDKSDDLWIEYTLILDISIPDNPNIDEQLTLVALNDKLQLYLNHDSQLCLVGDGTNAESNSKITLNEYFRLWITVRDQSIKIYINGTSEIESTIDNDQFHATSNRFDLFRENDLFKNTTKENKLRIQCQSITFLNRSISIDENLAQPNTSLETIIAPPLSMILPNLLAIGYKKEWILSVIEEHKTWNVQMIDTIIRENKEKLVEDEFENKQKKCLDILSRLNSEIDENQFKDITDLSQIILTDWNDLPRKKSDDNQDTSDKNEWFSQFIHGLPITSEDITEWIEDKTIITSESNTKYKLFDLSSIKSKQIHKSIHYIHENISQKQYFQSRIACEHGLTILNARYTILNMLKIWSTTLFSLEKFVDCTFLVTLLRLMDYYYTHENSHSDESNPDEMSLLIKSILTAEINQNKTSFIFQLQKDIINQIIQILLEPSLLDDYSDNYILIDEQTMIKQPNLKFIFKVLNLFVEVLMKQEQNESLVSLLFPKSMISLIFDLFLIVPTHQSKFSLLQIFSRLMQKIRRFQLTESIQHFLMKLLIECSTNEEISKNIETIIIEIIFLIYVKRKDQENLQKRELKIRLAELPQNIRDIFTAIDVINTLTGNKKEVLLFEGFFVRSRELLGNAFKLYPEEFEKSNSYFDINADQQLVDLMNKDRLLNTSFSNFICSLPTESIANPTFYKNYLLLSNIPADCIQFRAKFIYQLNQIIKNILPSVDFNLLPGESYLIDKIRSIKTYVLYSIKLQLFDETIENTDSDYENEWVTIHLDTVQANASKENNEQTIFHQAYQQLHANAHINFRRPNEQIWHVQYTGMYSTDHGGPYRDSITRICSDICSTRVPLFILCPNGRTNSGLNRDCWIPNVFPPNKSIPNKYKKQYRFIGQLMGMAIRKKHYLDLKFPILLWKQLLNEEITLEDIQDIDAQSFTMIDEMEKNIEQTKALESDSDINYVFSSIMSELRFDVVSSSGETYELIPGGMDIPITASNFKQYCTSYRQYRLNEFHRQIEFIRQGLRSIVPCYYLSLFTGNELEEAVCGKGKIDVELLKKNTEYSGRYTRDSPVIQRFWTVFDEMFTDEQRKLFLTFVWGRNTLPRRDQDFQCTFTISAYDVDDGDVDRALPKSHTCYFSIDLPEYSTVEIMYERLNYAITYCSSIDADGVINEAPDTTNVISDSSSDE